VKAAANGGAISREGRASGLSLPGCLLLRAERPVHCLALNPALVYTPPDCDHGDGRHGNAYRKPPRSTHREPHGRCCHSNERQSGYRHIRSPDGVPDSASRICPSRSLGLVVRDCDCLSSCVHRRYHLPSEHILQGVSEDTSADEHRRPHISPTNSLNYEWQFPGQCPCPSPSSLLHPHQDSAWISASGPAVSFPLQPD